MANFESASLDSQNQKLSKSLLPVVQNSKVPQSGQKFRRQHKDQCSVCAVCGDRANGYNFDAITCESCKAFFRRNALKDEDYHRCSSSNKCVIDSVSRRFCQKCRLIKCFQVGMKKEWIEDEDKLMQRKRKRIEKNKRKSSCPDTRTSITSDYSFENAAPIKRKPSSAGDAFDPKGISRSSSEGGSGAECASPILNRMIHAAETETTKKVRKDEFPDACFNDPIVRESVIQRLPAIVPSTTPILSQTTAFIWPINSNERHIIGEHVDKIVLPKFVLTELIRTCQECCRRCNAPVPPIVAYANMLYQS